MVGYIIPSDNVPMFISLLSWPLVLIPKHMWLSGDVERTRQTQPGWAGPGCPHERQKYQPWTRYALTDRGSVMCTTDREQKFYIFKWKRKMEAFCKRNILVWLVFFSSMEGGLRSDIKDCCCWTMTGWCSAVCHRLTVSHSQSLSLDISSLSWPASSRQPGETRGRSAPS